MVQDATAKKNPTSKTCFAFQGAPGAYSHVAALLFIKERGINLGLFPDGNIESRPNVVFAPCKTLKGVFDQVASGDSQFGVVPLANSSAGAMQKVYELILDYQVSFLADVYVPIHHQLLGIPGTTPESLKTIVSHPTVFKQCKTFLAKLPQAKIRAYWDTSSAAFFVKQKNDKSIAAIAGVAAAKATKLRILAHNIEDFAQNETRFAVVAPIQVAMQNINLHFPANPIMSCSVELDPDQIDFTNFFSTTIARYGASVLSTVTLPIEEQPWTFRYILDLSVTTNQQAQEVWAAIRESATRARILGIYDSISVSLNKPV